VVLPHVHLAFSSTIRNVHIQYVYVHTLFIHGGVCRSVCVFWQSCMYMRHICTVCSPHAYVHNIYIHTSTYRERKRGKKSMYTCVYKQREKEGKEERTKNILVNKVADRYVPHTHPAHPYVLAPAAGGCCCTRRAKICGNLLECAQGNPRA